MKWSIFRSPPNKRMKPLESMPHHHQIETTDEEIDALVYELYGLTDHEIKTVEEAAE